MKKRKNSLVFVILAGVVLIVMALALASGGGGDKKETSLTPQPFPEGPTYQPTPEIEGQLNPQQMKAMDRLAQESRKLPTVYAKEDVIRFLTLDVSISDSEAVDPSEKVYALFESYSDLFQIEDVRTQLVIVEENINDQGIHIIRLSQIYKSIPVFGSDLIVNLTNDGDITSVNGGYIPNLVISTTPTLSSDQAFESVVTEFLLENPDLVSEPVLKIYNPVVFGESGHGSRLVWELSIISNYDFSTYLVDSFSGQVLTTIPEVLSVKSINIYDGKFSTDDRLYRLADKGKLDSIDKVLDPEKYSDEDAKNVFVNFNKVYNYFWDKFERDSYDNGGAELKAYINIKITKTIFNISGCPQAFWSGTLGSMIFCDNYTSGLDILAHEFTHGVTGSTAGLEFIGGIVSESGALNESYSDVFAAFADDTQNSWTISWDNQGNCVIRDLSDPTHTQHNSCKSKNQKPEKWEFPDHYDNIVKPSKIIGMCTGAEAKTYGCAHANSTIPSHAAYLLTKGGTHQQSRITVEGIGKKKAEQIYYKTLTEGLSSNSDFLQARKSTILACEALIPNPKYGITQNDCEQVKNAFAAVGIGEPGEKQQPGEVTPTVPLIQALSSSTMLIMDTSGSMEDKDISGGTKLEAAQKAGGNILNIIAAENQAGATPGQVGVVDFNSVASVDAPLSSDVGAAQAALQGLYATGRTAMADGLKLGIDQLSAVSGTDHSMVILLSDGMPNVPLSGGGISFSVDEQAIRQEVIDLAAQAGQQNICVYTIGFGIPGTQGTATGYGSIDEDFLRQVAQASGCGTYYNAQDATQLANVFVELRHASMGQILLQKSGQVAQDEQVELGTAAVEKNQEMLLFTLNWPGSRLEPVVKDPKGQIVDQDYPGAQISTSSSLVSLIITDPLPGDWLFSMYGADVPEGVTSYNALVSSRLDPNPQPELTSGGFMFVILIIVIAGGGIFVYVMSQTMRKTSRGGAAAAAVLIGTTGLNAGVSIQLQPTFSIGRTAANDLRIAEPQVSRQHARIRYAQDAWFIQDQGSSGGTFVNGQPVQGQRLKNGDQIQIGSSIFIFKE